MTDENRGFQPAPPPFTFPPQQNGTAPVAELAAEPASTPKRRGPRRPKAEGEGKKRGRPRKAVPDKVPEARTGAGVSASIVAEVITALEPGEFNVLHQILQHLRTFDPDQKVRIFTALGYLL